MTTDQPAVSAAIVVDCDRVLLIRRRVPEGALVWQFPAGKVEPGETAERVAVREAAEETGLTVKVLLSLGERAHPVTGRRMSYFACEVVSGTAQVAAPREVSDVAWVSLEEIPEYVPDGLFGIVQGYLEEVLAR